MSHFLSYVHRELNQVCSLVPPIRNYSSSGSIPSKLVILDARFRDRGIRVRYRLVRIIVWFWFWFKVRFFLMSARIKKGFNNGLSQLRKIQINYPEPFGYMLRVRRFEL